MNEKTLSILVGIDFSECSEMALAHAVKFAERSRARLHICHIAPGNGVTAPLSLGMNIPEQFPEAREARTRLERVKANLGTNLDIELHVRIGTPVESILTLIHELKPDMVVVCSQGKSLVKRALLGSVSNRLVQLSPVPVVVVPTPGREAILYQPEPPKEPELPSVGRAVAESHNLQTADGGIAGLSGSAVHLG